MVQCLYTCEDRIKYGKLIPTEVWTRSRHHYDQIRDSDTMSSVYRLNWGRDHESGLKTGAPTLTRPNWLTKTSLTRWIECLGV